MAAKLWPKQSWLFLIVFMVIFLLSGVLGVPFFTSKPPQLQYYLVGDNATFNWDYDSSGTTILLAKWKRMDLSYACMITTGSNPPVVSSKAVCESFVLRGNATLVLKNVSKNMDGDYECVLDFNDFTELKNSTSLRVVSKTPVFSAVPSKIVGIEGGSDVLISVNVAGDYSPLITWFKNGATVNASQFTTVSKTIANSGSSDQVIQSNLTIHSPTRSINGHFLVAKAVYGTHSPSSNISIEIDVWYGPENLKISSPKSGMGVVLGQSATVTCSANSNPPPKYTIFHNGSAILTNSTAGSLTISNFARNDSGNYSCMASNAVGNATIDGVWFFYIEPVVTTTTKPTTQISTSNGTVSTITTPGSNSTANRGGTTGESNELPWWVWLAIGLGILLLIAISIMAYFIIKCQKSKKSQPNGAMRFSKKGFDIDNYIVNTNYSRGYENERGVDEERQVGNGAVTNKPETEEEMKDRLGYKFESEHDLIEHYRQRPEEYNDVDFKDHDPFEEDDIDSGQLQDPYASDNKDPMAFENDIFEPDDVDDMVKVKSESDKESDKESALFQDLGEDIIQYDI